MAVLTGMLTTIRAEGANSVERISMLASLRTAAADVRVLGATTAVVVAGSTAAVTTLARAARAARRRRLRGIIGLVFSAAAVLFIIGSAATGWFGQRAVRLRTVLAAGLILAVAISPATASSAPLCLVVMLCATATLRSVLWTVGYPLGATGANQSGVGLGVVMGILNGVWALSAVVSPLVGERHPGRLRRPGDVRDHPDRARPGRWWSVRPSHGRAAAPRAHRQRLAVR